MPINRAANYHNVAGISQRKGVWRQPYDNFVAVTKYDVKLCQQVNLRGKEPTFYTNQSQ